MSDIMVSSADTQGNVQGVGDSNDLSDMTVDELAFMIAVQQTDKLDQDIKARLDDVQNQQANLERARDIYSHLSALKNGKSYTEDGKTYSGDLSPSDKQWLKDHGVDYSKGDWDTDLTNVKTYEDNLNSSIELKMLNIQSTMNKRNQMLQMASNIMKKAADAESSIIRNIQ